MDCSHYRGGYTLRKKPDSFSSGEEIISTAKEDILEFVRQLPDDSSYEDIERKILEDIRYKRYIQSMVERAREQKQNGQMLSHEKMGEHLGIDK